MTDLQLAAQAVLDRWDSPQWKWDQQGSTADLMHVLRAAIAQPVSNIAFLYEELRKATDGGSESMTHDDALAQIKYWSDMAAIAQPVQPAAAWHPTEAAIAALKRFEETCSDGEGYDVPKDTMRNLAAIGLIYKTHGATYRITDFGRHILEAPIAQALPS